MNGFAISRSRATICRSMSAEVEQRLAAGQRVHAGDELGQGVGDDEVRAVVEERLDRLGAGRGAARAATVRRRSGR